MVSVMGGEVAVHGPAPSRRPVLPRWASAVVTVGGIPLFVLLSPELGRPEADGAGHVAVVLAGAVLVGALLLLRRRRPLAVLVACLAVSAVVVLLTGAPSAVLLGAVVALHGVAARRPVRTAVLAWAGCAATVLAVELLTGGWDERVLAPIAVLAAAAAVGVAVAKQREVVLAAQERARAAERSRDEVAARRVADERLRIARDLHDVVAHHVAVMGVHAGVASHFLGADPAKAQDALAQVRASGRTALSELGAVVGLLRTAGEEDVAAPVPGLAQLPALLELVRRSGLEVDDHGVGAGTGAGAGGVAGAGGLDELRDITAYRIVQESLTNALRHGSGTAELGIEHQRDAVVVRVTNPVRAGVAGVGGDGGVAGGGGGHGLVGMRERAALVGAALTAGPVAGGRFEVVARLPRGER